MDTVKFNKIKEKAIADNIPIIMDDTLAVLEKRFTGHKFERILEIGTAVRVFCYLFF